jgi:hypothetical protein
MLPMPPAYDRVADWTGARANSDVMCQSNFSGGGDVELEIIAGHGIEQSTTADSFLTCNHFAMHILVALVLAAVLQSASPAADGTLVADVAILSAAATNEARFDALTTILRERKLSFEIETFTLNKPIGSEPRSVGRNIVVSLGAGDEHVVIGAHYDAVRLSDGSLSRGAVDNAASSVMLVRLAEAFRSQQLTRRLHIVWFDMEELGLRGSAVYAQRHADRKTTAMVNFDINAYGDSVLFGPAGQDINVALQQTLLTTCASEKIDCVAFPQMPPGDDRPFTQRKIPTLSLAMLPAVELHQLWLMINAGSESGLKSDSVPSILQVIHTPADQVDKVSGDAMARALRLAVAVVRRLLNPRI